ncbi:MULTISPECIES: glutamine--fructose-6-phosphate transaminase (isomerizing) [Psychrobacter]|jgi:glucosamine--fructose-6-phosphate aminotransferase (isomerizing)|uniref:Glutamine--fructose-6-phosphate aminotransferase [isomerizing] n=2 Tax=root TaxID=1 RepID=A0ABT6INY2_9GAMM|nr:MULTISPECIES: glutamine--fructose-6-phosphate transaminase (isomerizing) [Psychrobacter]AOY44302.1 glucosamine--fructose-6-phosphate aminotransferase [Psychrobacter sp. AntiMn-1]MDH4903547.1 glutamine--fructose-6-phosphate transaminase (isomerizing) [Psychrobacter pocilloporae]HBD04506.1 glutamine--fructose-6-phosphate transaminase (isomerizing) [Psychrobacter sp.]|tara:strand:+ start:2963 stop:4807 length:1845 start_codon:yes stop_codon:yes gene_type:complete
MCGIVGAVAERNIANILLEGLKRLEYRGYDSAGLTVIRDGELHRERQVGKVQALVNAVEASTDFFDGHIGIAHTRWATHGEPAQRNAHPHISGKIAVVHNGIVENYAELKKELIAKGYEFTSQTDTEVVAHLIHDIYEQTNDLLEAVRAVIPKLHGAFALGIIHVDTPDELAAVRLGSPLVIGVGIGENFIASDQLALLPVTNRFMYLEEGDIAKLTRDSIKVYVNGEEVSREVHEIDAKQHNADKGEFKHYMLKEIYEQPDAVARTLEMAIDNRQASALRDDFLARNEAQLSGVQHVQIIACGTSYHAGMVAKYWFESLMRLSCSVEVASEFRYRNPVVLDNSLVICISQSGETADTLSALREIKKQNPAGLVSLALCNVPTSSLVRETDIFLPTLAGPEIGVASTKAFTTQLVALMLLVLKTGAVQQRIDSANLSTLLGELQKLPGQLYASLHLDAPIKAMAEHFEDKKSCLFLGRGLQFPIALEGALKLKEISYIHAEGYAAGELKHGPLALVDKDMPIVVLAPKDSMLDKLKANMQEVHARHGELFVFASEDSHINAEDRLHVVYVKAVCETLAPIVYSVPIQLLSYHVAVMRGTDVDQPRNLAKSVTVE